MCKLSVIDKFKIFKNKYITETKGKNALLIVLIVKIILDKMLKNYCNIFNKKRNAKTSVADKKLNLK